MRPRKVILLVNEDEAQLGMQRFMLETRGYRVLTALDVTAALELHAPGVDLVLGFADGMLKAWAALAEQMKALRPETAILLLTKLKSPNARFSLAPLADSVMDGNATSTVELLERVRLMVARKRGPRKAVVLEPALAMAGD
jgi:two-component system response regulator CpxR